MRHALFPAGPVQTRPSCFFYYLTPPPHSLLGISHACTNLKGTTRHVACALVKDHSDSLSGPITWHVWQSIWLWLLSTGWQWSNQISQLAHVNLALAFDAPSVKVWAPQFISITGWTSNDPSLGCERKHQIHRACSCCTTSPLHLCPTSARWDQLWRLLRSSCSDFLFDHWRLSCTSVFPFDSTMSISRTRSCPN